MKKQKRISTEKPNTNKTTRIYVIYLVISRFEPCLLNILLQIIFYECTFENVTIKNCGDRLLFCCRRSHRWYHCFWCGWVLSQFWVVWNGAAQLPRTLCCCMSIEAARECRKTSSEMLLNCTNASAKLWARMRMKKKNVRTSDSNERIDHVLDNSSFFLLWLAFFIASRQKFTDFALLCSYLQLLWQKL